MPVVIKRYDSCCTTEFVWKNSDKMQIRKNMVGTIAKAISKLLVYTSMFVTTQR